MLEQLGPEAREIVVLSQEIAQSMGHGEVCGEHLLLALFERIEQGLAAEFADIGISYEQLFSAVQANLPTRDSVLEREFIELSAEVQIVIVRSAMEAERLGSNKVFPKHIFIAFEWYGVAERGNFSAWELLLKSGPEHKIRVLFGNIEFRTPSKESSKPKARRKTDPKVIEVTDVVNMAQAEARRLGHGEVAPEHLLLAFTDDRFSQQALTLLSVDPRKLRGLLEDKFSPRADFIPVEIPFHPIVKKILEGAFKCARDLGDNFIGNEHLFQSFIQIGKEKDFRAFRLLMDICDLNINALESVVKRQLSDRKIDQGQKFPVQPEPSEKSQSRREEPIFDWVTSETFKSDHEIIKAAEDAAFKHGHNRVGTQYLLFALARTPNTVATDILEEIGLNPNEIDRLLLQKYGRGPLREQGPMLFTQAIPLILEYAKEIATEGNAKTIESEHLLQAIVRMGKRFDGCVAWEIICETGKADRLEALLMAPQTVQKSAPLAELTIGRTDFFSKTTINLFYLAKAESLSLNHKTIEPEHLFLAMQAMPSLDVIDIIKSLNLDVAESRKIVETIAGKGKGKKSTDKVLSLSANTKSLLESAFKEARQLGNTQIEPVHILLAIAKNHHDENVEGVLAYTLNALKLKSNLIVEVIMNLLREEVEPEIKRTRQYVPDKNDYRIPSNFSATSLRVVETAHNEARRFGYPEIEPDHLLLGLVKETSNEVSSMFLSRGISIKILEQEFSKFRDRGPGGSSRLCLSEMVREIFNLASKECSDEVEPQDLLGYLILSMDLTTINVLRGLGLEDLLEGVSAAPPPVVLFNFLHKSNLNDYYLSDSLKVIFRSQEFARQCGHKFAGPEHLLIALLENHQDASVILLRGYGVTMQDVRKSFRKLVGIGSIYDPNEILLSPNAIDVLIEASNLVDELNSEELHLGHILMSILQLKTGATAELLKTYDLPADINDQLVIAMGNKREK